MTDELHFAARNYITLAGLLLACWGLGQTLFTRLLRVRSDDPWLNWALACASGIGVFIVALQGLAVSGHLRRGPLNVLLASGLLLALLQLWRQWHLRHINDPHPRWQPQGPRWLNLACAALILVMLIPTAVAPLSPPFEWDEMMYHLPHARQWALTGHLSVNEWLRYPWFPYNYDLLYAAGLILRGDVFTHFLHSLAGWLTALMVYRLGLRHAGSLTACLATAIWLGLNLNFFANAYVDMGMALFVTGAAAACLLWLQDSRKPGWLLVSAFMLGLAVGAKYQGLFFLPLFFVVLLCRDRRPGTMVLAAMALLLPCLYWYTRNAVYTGDPFDPLGGKLFGFYDWNAADYQFQLADLKHAANWPKPPFWPLLLAPFLRPWRAGMAWTCALVFSVYALLSWYLSSHYDRYLVPSMPVLGLLSAWTMVELLRRFGLSVARRWPALRSSLQSGLPMAGLLLGGGLALVYAKHEWHNYAWRVSPTQEQRDRFLEPQIVAYELLKKLHTLPDLKIYQWGMEDVIYYAPNPIWGEIFGPWRYSDLDPLSAPELASHLRRQGFNTLLVRDTTLARLTKLPDFEKHFILLSPGKGAKAFTIVQP